MTKDAAHFQLTYWEDVREEVKAVNPDLANIIDDMSPDRRYPLVRACYQFGDLIVNKGETFLPSADGLLSLNDSGIQKILGDKLSYSTIPLFLILKNANEVFIKLPSKAISLNLFYPGSFLGAFESVDAMFGRVSDARWSVSAGARNIFTLPRINEINGFNRLKMAYGLNDNIRPKNLMGHWQIFNQIARHPNFEQPWHNIVLFFTKKWLLNSHKDQAWFNFKNYLFSDAWKRAQFAISKVSLSLVWEDFSNAIASRCLKPTSYLADQVKHIILTASGRWPGFKAADSSDKIAPVNGLQKAIMDIYRLKKYYPTIMHTNSVEEDSHGPLYYSLAYPTFPEGSYDINMSSTLMSNMREIKRLIETIEPTLDNLSETAPMFKGIKFDYFHVEADKYGEIKQSTELLNLDSRLLNNKDTFPGREFCATSQFWRGTISIRKTEN